jgi:ribosome maturation factor RimP
MKEREKEIIKHVTDLAEPILAEEGLEPVEIQYRREKPGWVLRVFIDRTAASLESVTGHGSGVSLQDCTEVSRELGRILDLEDVIPGAYTLEVSSPGLDRPLTKPADYHRFAGRLVRVKFVGPEGRRRIKGRLVGLENEQIMVEVGDQVMAVPYEQAKRVQLEPELDWPRTS